MYYLRKNQYTKTYAIVSYNPFTIFGISRKDYSSVEYTTVETNESIEVLLNQYPEYFV